ncbi:hypothetical protein [Quisquiliibacterium transsilvanicum]|uniref:UDP-N-acetylmuramate--alanine ligase n=1 Tax=Quisquiliibacterium transsilvanicum TaxID=1549638 RepID=A0A7W8HHN7_9BURK|nr:hypothetical protein [Quisquiliibacterium transsilvanicum]MBB5271626.1 hypothetical protein [Quisquiliibacterium transsilvanicum]
MDSGHDGLRREIAAAAARLIADGGLDYGNAKFRAARELCGGRAPKGSLPDNDEIDEALREHLELFDEGHAQRVDRMRRTAAALMEQLAAFHPLVTGGVWKGIVAEHAPIHLQLFHDNGKEVQFWLLDHKVDFDSDSVPHFRGHGEVEAVGFDWQGEPVMLSIYRSDDLRGALRAGTGRQPDRGDRAALVARLEAAR